jgi:hypothetical protein
VAIGIIFLGQGKKEILRKGTKRKEWKFKGDINIMA